MRLERETLWMSVGEFDEWKKNVEKSTISQFVRTHISRSVSGTVTTFTCHRSGILKGRPRKLRRTKLNGSKKVGGLCPAQISVRQSRNDKACAVSYIKTHLGHPVGDEKELGYVFLSREERLRVAEKIAAGVPFERILDDITSPDVGGDRLKLINRQDLVNISLAHKLKKQPFRGNLFEQPAVDVEAFVREYADSILLYKKPDEVVDPRHPSLAADDFVLIIMTELQREMLRSYGNNVVAVDGARAATGCQFVLQSVLVLDEYREAFPAAFAISNRADETVLDIFLTCVREKVGVLRPSTLVTSMQQSCYESWRRIMATPGQRLYCTWHVNQAWLEQLKQVTNKEKQYKLKQKLYDLRLEAYRVPFAEKLQAFLADVDEETRGFVDYFKRRFAGTAAYWANCYRTCRVESFDAVVRHLHGEERNAETLPGMLKALKKYLQQREVDCQIKKIRGKLTPKLKRLRSRHDSIEKCRNFVMIERTKPDEWLVSSFSGQDAVAELYAVQRVERQCDECTLYCEKCDICFHEYRCSCRDSIKKANMCVHIHGLGIFLKSGRKATASEDANVTTSDCDSHSVNADAAATEPTVIKVDSNSADKTVTPVKIHTGPTWAERDCNPEALCHQIRIEDTPVLFESDLSSIDSVGILANPAVPSEVIDPTESDWCFDFEYGSVHITFASDPSDSEVALAPASLQGLDRVEPDAGLMHADWYLNGECDAMSSAAEHKQPSMAGMSNMSDEFEMGKDNLQESILVNPMDSPWCLGSDCGSMYSAAVSESTFMELYPTSGAESIPIAGASQVPKDREHFRDEMLSVLHDAESTEELNNMINKFIDQIT